MPRLVIWACAAIFCHMKPIIPIALAALSLAACKPEEPPKDACGAAASQGVLGQNIAATSFANDANIRAYQEGSPLTRDYRLDRMNVEYDATGVIIRVWCG